MKALKCKTLGAELAYAVLLLHLTTVYLHLKLVGIMVIKRACRVPQLQSEQNKLELRKESF